MGMTQDNARLKQDSQESSLLRMKDGTELEKRVCQWAQRHASVIAVELATVKDVTMMNLPLPGGYILRNQADRVKPNLKLCKIVGGEEMVVNDDNPVVELCLVFYRDMQDGLLRKIGAAISNRIKEFRAADTLFRKLEDDGVSFETGKDETTTENRFEYLDVRA